MRIGRRRSATPLGQDLEVLCSNRHERYLRRDGEPNGGVLEAAARRATARAFGKTMVEMPP